MENAFPKPAHDDGPPPIVAADATTTSFPTADQLAIEAAARALYHQGRKGSNWFYWVAGLSLVNSVILHTGGNFVFVVGLGVTLVADVVGSMVAKQHPNIGGVAIALAFGFDILASLIVVGFGWLAGKRYTVVFAVGMGLYFLDGLLYVWFRDWMSVGFHIFALVCMWSGITAYRQLNVLEAALRAMRPAGSEPGAMHGEMPASGK